MRKKDMARALGSYDLDRISPSEYPYILRSLGVLRWDGSVSIVHLKLLHQALIHTIVPEEVWERGPEGVEPLLMANTGSTRLLGYVDDLWREYNGEEQKA